MMLPILLALQSPVAPATDRPIRVWMDATGPVVRGHGVRLYVQAAEPGNLVVLHSRSDGRIEVLFPARPTDDPHVTAGAYEVRGLGDGPVWTVSEPDGDGLILAALSPDPIWFNEFSHDASWSPSALTPSWNGADPSGGMTDIVQRMLGDGGFTYDVLRYTVVAPLVAQAPDSGAGSDSTSTLVADDAALTTCGVSSPVECQPMGQPLFGIRGFRRGSAGRGFDRDGRPHAGAPASAPRAAVAAPLVFPIRKTPLASGPVVPRPRGVPDAPSRVGRLDPRPVAGAAPDHLAGAAPAARSALALRYVRAAVAPEARTAVGAGSGLRVAAAAPAHTAVALMSRPVPASVAFRGGVVLAPRAAAVPHAAAAPRATAAPATQSHGTRSSWMVMGGRVRGR